MPLALGTSGLVLVALLWMIALPVLRESLPRVRRALLARVGARPESVVADGYDPGRELRAEQRARALLRSCVNEEEWAMYRDLGFIRVWASTLGQSRRSAAPRARPSGPDGAYLLYPHLPIIAYQPKTRRLVGEYCVTFEDQSRPYGSGRLPDADDVLAKWMALRGDEDEVVSIANMHLPGRQVPVEQVHRDLRRLAQWEQAQVRQSDRHTAAAS
jgi:hypothetical protein